MTKYSDLDLTALIDLLVIETSELTHLITEGGIDGEKYIQLRDSITSIQEEIQHRVAEDPLL